MTQVQGVVLFPSVHFVLRAEKIAKEKGFSVKLIPVPRHLSSDCGVGLRISWEEKEAILEALEEAKVPVEAVHPIPAKQ
jgi:hypothetical protein